MKIKNVVFDFGNVLVKWSPLEVLRVVFPERSAEELYQDIRPVWLDLNLGKVSEKEAAVLYLKQLNIPENKTFEMFHAFKTSQVPIPGMFELLETLRNLSVPLFAITDNVKEIVEWYKTHMNFLGYFIDVVVSADIGVLKPDRRIYEHLLNKNKLVAAESVFLDDLLINVEGAKAVGMAAFQYTDVTSCIGNLKSLGVF